MKSVLVTGIGGNVGQGIIRNIRATKFDVRVVGCNTLSFSAGNHLCDGFYLVPFASAENYTSEVQKIVKHEQIDLIIPSTDLETYYLAKNKDLINCTIAVSSEEAAGTYLDKYKSALFHEKNNIAFAKTILPSQYKGEFLKTIAKPKLGRGSRGLVFNPADVTIFSDDEYIIQELHEGLEITSAFYVNKDKKLHGQLTMVRELENGMTSKTSVYREADEQVEKILKQIISRIDICGSANLQSIVTKDKRIIPFEINCRISGTNSIRGNFGFEDVKYTLQEYLYNREADKPLITEGIAIRIYMDVIYPKATSPEDCLTNSAPHYLF